ncbi:MAG: GNAT family N-acetyltransferase [Nitrososphaerota archaeon]|jgi:ribosomal protein S18 acetylase RimI-like enzyme|uniref:N-acetyltransferase n=1 Tax=Candidatus Bathycorpusculum sp. TaxID=2994959 RepID=UPI00283A2703|nr:GNAT family N-acetyltransferase [Candidatus Termiticorpusculum sp.]MCL2257001.1 GNAT family N-acetyltransferase [Candidatus Termiticorpusculum sp.]MCL2292875.1 GNAT family N-acetyltransferase [Candidatus Termiticorpusculum sp.]MDR0460147.1 GNAT family N-acetyltransferase [Nitrososphaerota archaeon]
MDIQISVALFEDLAAIVELERQCFMSEAFSRQQISYLLNDSNSISLVAKIKDNGDKEKIVGFAILQLEKDHTETEMLVGHIVTLNVTVAFRRMGVAQKLLFTCEEKLRLQGVFECRLEVRQTNYAALKLYRQMGYEETGLLKKYYGKEHGLYFKKKFC